MLKRRAALVLASVMLSPSLATPAQAFFDQPWITPSNPGPGTIVSLNIRFGECDGIYSQAGYPQITVDGTNIHVIEYGAHETFHDICVVPPSAVTFPIGAFQSGNYLVTANFRYDNYPFGIATIPIGTVAFAVLPNGQAPMPAPTIGYAALFILLVSLIFLAQRRHRAKCGFYCSCR